MRNVFSIFLLTLAATIAVLFMVSKNTLAQEIRKPMKLTEKEQSEFQIRYGMAFSTRYMWRGLNLSKAPVFEPYASFLFHGLELSFYGVYGLSESEAKHPDFEKPSNPEEIYSPYLDKVAFSQVISNLFYNFGTEIGTFTLGATGYYFSDMLIKRAITNSLGDTTSIGYIKPLWDNWKDNRNGSHTLEANFRFSGNKDFPLWVIVGYNFYNDPDKSIFAEVGYTFRVLKNNLSFFAGGVLDASEWYQFTIKNGVLQDGTGLTNFGFILNRELKLEDWLTLDFALLDVMNFYEERNTILFKATLKIE
ncbi:MAG: hypothetical protein KJO12_04840 [Ignavibacteria bacterium]|nr:hypothetical protein [Ignavibacteria bacterium]